MNLNCKIKKPLTCLQTGERCEHNCGSNIGGYAGDDCWLVSEKYDRQDNLFGIVILVIVGLGIGLGIIINLI